MMTDEQLPEDVFIKMSVTLSQQMVALAQAAVDRDEINLTSRIGIMNAAAGNTFTCILLSTLKALREDVNEDACDCIKRTTVQAINDSLKDEGMMLIMAS